MPSKTMLTTRRLRMARMVPRRSHKLRATLQYALVMEWLGGVLTPRQLELEYEYFQRQQRRNGFTFWVLERKSNKAFLGFCGIIRVTERSSTVLGELEVGWRLRSDMWRRGYAFEAAFRVLEHSFATLATNQVIARVASGNEASQMLMLKLGMPRKRRLDYVHPGDRTKLLVYAIERAKFERTKSDAG